MLQLKDFMFENIPVSLYESVSEEFSRYIVLVNTKFERYESIYLGRASRIRRKRV